MLRFLVLLASSACFALLPCCACGEEPQARVWPAGTVVAVDDVPITSAEIAQDLLGVLLVEPQWGEAQWKRLAFNEVALPRAVLRARTRDAEREAARRTLDEYFSRIAQGSLLGPRESRDAYGRELSGSWKELGLVAWGSAMNLAVGEWSDVLEEPGAFVRVRLLERRQGIVPAATTLRVDRIDAAYASPDPGAALETELKRHRLTIVDPAWDAIVPERTKYLMGVHDR